MYVYLMRAANRVKIGYANNVDKRVKQLQTGCPLKINVIFAGYVGTKAPFIENLLHVLFKRKRVANSEWFSLDRKEIGDIIHLIKNHYNEDIVRKITYKYEDKKLKCEFEALKAKEKYYKLEKVPVKVLYDICMKLNLKFGVAKRICVRKAGLFFDFKNEIKYTPDYINECVDKKFNNKRRRKK